MRDRIASWLPALLLFTLPAGAEEPSAERVNKAIAPIAVVGIDGKPARVPPAGDAKATAVVFLSFDCPVSNSSTATLADLAKAFADRGVRFVGVCPTDEQADALKKRVEEFKLPFPVYFDPKLAAVGAFKATTTPEAFVLDAGGVLRYRGRIDDAYSARLKKNPRVSSHDLKDALESVLAGRPVATPATKPVGCPIAAEAPPAKGESAVTYHRDVVPILQRHCQSCHRPGNVGPFALMTYKQSVRWAEDIKEYTRARTMPPWKPTAGMAFANDRRMGDKEIATLAAWVEAGCPEGDPKDAPKPVAYSDEWQLGKPDLVLSPAEDFHVGPTGGDVFRCFVIPTGLTEDRYIVAYEIKPGNPRVTHHTLNYFDGTGKARELASREAKRAKKPDAPDRGPGYPVGMGIGFIPTPDMVRPDGVPLVGAFGGWAPGQMATRLPPGTGFRLPKEADVVLQAHYHRTGRPEADRTRIGLYLADRPVEKVFQTITVGGMSPLTIIPAGKADYAAKGSRWLLTDATLHSVLPHMHLLGRRIKVTMTLPGGEPVVLVEIADWDYNWQETYWFKTPIKAKAGTRIDVEAVYDNSAKNPNNPNRPPRMVFFGEETTSEMLYAFLGATPDGPGRVRASRTDPAAVEKKKND
jgi:mono/diheme cytochrome c family protein